MKLEQYELINFINLPEIKLLKILEWRNNNNIRKWMFNSSLISEEEHLNFIKKLKSDLYNKYFLVLKESSEIGVVYFNNISKNSLEIGIYANPLQRGVGNDLMKVIINYAFIKLNVKKIVSEVLEKNYKAIELYLKFGFKKSNLFNYNGKNIISMELINENR